MPAQALIGMHKVAIARQVRNYTDLLRVRNLDYGSVTKRQVVSANRNQLTSDGEK